MVLATDNIFYDARSMSAQAHPGQLRANSQTMSSLWASLRLIREAWLRSLQRAADLWLKLSGRQIQSLKLTLGSVNGL
jgi:hypothetical protein